MSLRDEIEQLQIRAERYDNIQKNQEQIFDTLRNVRDEINQILSNNDIKTIINKNTSRKRKSDLTTVYEKLYEILNKGEYVNRKMIEKTFPELTEKQAKDIFYGLPKTDYRIKKTKIDGKNNYFIELATAITLYE